MCLYLNHVVETEHGYGLVFMLLSALFSFLDWRPYCFGAMENEVKEKIAYFLNEASKLLTSTSEPSSSRASASTSGVSPTLHET